MIHTCASFAILINVNVRTLRVGAFVAGAVVGALVLGPFAGILVIGGAVYYASRTSNAVAEAKEKQVIISVKMVMMIAMVMMLVTMWAI